MNHYKHSPAVNNNGCRNVLRVLADVSQEIEGWLRRGGHSVIGPRREPEMSDISRYKLLSRVEENTYHMPIACQVHVHCLLSIHARKRVHDLKKAI